MHTYQAQQHLGCPHTKSSTASSRQAAVEKHNNALELTDQTQESSYGSKQAAAIGTRCFISCLNSSCLQCQMHGYCDQSELRRRESGCVLWSTMDIEQLIAEVFVCPAVWNSRDVKHSDRMYVTKQWNQIAVKLGATNLCLLGPPHTIGVAA